MPSAQNPADYASRGVCMSSLLKSRWTKGPKFLWEDNLPQSCPNFEVPDGDPEVKLDHPVLNILACSSGSLNSVRFSLLERVTRFSKWRSALSFLAILFYIVRERWKVPYKPSVEKLNFARDELLRIAQASCFASELSSLSGGSELSTESPLRSLDPFIDDSGILRVGGRLRLARLPNSEQHPVILPRRSHVTTLLACETLS